MWIINDKFSFKRRHDQGLGSLKREGYIDPWVLGVTSHEQL
jgi:hypothetical protein